MLEEVQDSNWTRMPGDLMKDRRECIGLEEVRDPGNRVFEDGQTCMMNRSDMQGSTGREWNEQSPVEEDCLIPQKRGFLKNHWAGVEDSTRCHHQLMGTASCLEVDSMDMRLSGHNSVCRGPQTGNYSLDYFQEVLICSVPVALG